jgi:hypothetical protein
MLRLEVVNFHFLPPHLRTSGLRPAQLTAQVNVTLNFTTVLRYIALFLSKSSSTHTQDGYPPTPPVRHSSCPDNQHHELARKLLLQVLHVPPAQLATIELRRG